MNNITIDIEKLKLILIKYHKNFRYKNNECMKDYNDRLINEIDEILSYNIKKCVYSNDILVNDEKMHLIINFTLKDSTKVSFNVPYSKYCDLL